MQQHAEIAAFAPPLVTTAQLSAAKYTRIFGSDNDPYCPEGAVASYGEPLDLPVGVPPGAAHLDLDAGYGSWPSLLVWSLDQSNDIPIEPRTDTDVVPG